MSVTVIALLMFSSMILLLVTGRQIFIIVGAVGTIAALCLWGSGAEDMPYLGGFSYMKWYPLLALPPFVLMGYTLSKSGLADRLYDTMYLWAGRMPGGLAMGTVGICALMATMSGLSFCATVTAGTISLPAMLKRKYDKKLATGVILAAGALGFLIPPSIVFILYGMIARVSIGHLWIAGILPGVLLATMYVIYIGVRCRISPELGPPLPPDQRVDWRKKFRSLSSAISPIILVFMVLGLLFSGVTSLIECSAVGATGALIIAALNKKLTRQNFNEILQNTLHVSVMILWIIVAAILFGAVFDGLGAVHSAENILNIVGGGNRWHILIAMQFSFILMGMVLDDTAMLLIVAPLYIPLVADLGFDLVWYGVLYVLNCQMAYITPPFGYNLFILRGIASKEITVADLYRAAIPFVCIQATCLAIIMIFPQIALWLPNRVFGGA